jgi:hypothetical protein
VPSALASAPEALAATAAPAAVAIAVAGTAGAAAPRSVVNPLPGEVVAAGEPGCGVMPTASGKGGGGLPSDGKAKPIGVGAAAPAVAAFLSVLLAATVKRLAKSFDFTSGAGIAPGAAPIVARASFGIVTCKTGCVAFIPQ